MSVGGGGGGTSISSASSTPGHPDKKLSHTSEQSNNCTPFINETVPFKEEQYMTVSKLCK